MTRNGRQHTSRPDGTTDPSLDFQQHPVNDQLTTGADPAASTTAPASDGQLLYRIEEAARLLRLGRTTMYALIQDGSLRAVHIGRSCRITRAELERFTRRLDTRHHPVNTPTPIPATEGVEHPPSRLSSSRSATRRPSGSFWTKNRWPAGWNFGFSSTPTRRIADMAEAIQHWQMPICRLGLLAPPPDVA
jgi:excisionase family DNA binding protein